MCRVLIADDEPKVLLLIRSLIEWDELGLQLVATANDGISALALIGEHKPDIVITDIRMPGYDGIELIARAQEFNPAIDFIIISGYRHFDYAQKAIRFGVEDYLLKPLKAVEINQTLRKMIEKYRLRDLARQREEEIGARIEEEVRIRQERFLAVLAQRDNDVTAADGSAQRWSWPQVSRDFGLDFAHGLFQACVVKADVNGETLNANVRKLLQEKTMSVVRDAFPALSGESPRCLLQTAERGIYAVLNFPEEQKKAMRKALLGIIDELQSQSEIFDRIKVTVGLGRLATTPGELALSFADAETAVADRLCQGTGRIIDGAPAGDEARADHTRAVVGQLLSADVRKRLLQNVEILDAGELAALLESLAQAALGNKAVDGRATLALFAECAQVLHFGLKSQNAIDAWVDRRIVATTDLLGMCSTQREVFQLLAAHAAALIGHIVELKKNENAKPIREAQRYIAAHYAEPIGLEAVSQRAGFNPTYFSLLFKKETGTTFLEYLTDVRMREAKLLLADPRRTIADVAEQVGYSDVKHFSRVFARNTGIHPSKYRKLYY